MGPGSWERSPPDGDGRSVLERRTGGRVVCLLRNRGCFYCTSAGAGMGDGFLRNLKQSAGQKRNLLWNARAGQIAGIRATGFWGREGNSDVRQVRRTRGMAIRATRFGVEWPRERPRILASGVVGVRLRTPADASRPGAEDGPQPPGTCRSRRAHGPRDPPGSEDKLQPPGTLGRQNPWRTEWPKSLCESRQDEAGIRYQRVSDARSPWIRSSCHVHELTGLSSNHRRERIDRWISIARRKHNGRSWRWGLAEGRQANRR